MTAGKTALNFGTQKHTLSAVLLSSSNVEPWLVSGGCGCQVPPKHPFKEKIMGRELVTEIMLIVGCIVLLSLVLKALRNYMEQRVMKAKEELGEDFTEDKYPDKIRSSDRPCDWEKLR